MAPPTRAPATEDSPTAVHQPVAPPPTPAPATLGGAAASDRCANCGAVLAGDQRYCLECGERRGAARFTPRPASTRAVTTTTTEGPPRAPRLSGGSTLIAGVGTLLLAMGIGVLIGRDGSTSAAPANSKVQVVQVPGGSGVAANTASTPAAGTGSGSTGSGNKSGKGHRSGKKTAASTNHLSAANATQTVKSLPPPTVTVGQAGHGPGYTKGHFTGTFFGP